jgi:GT2 family glycosyltransferase
MTPLLTIVIPTWNNPGMLKTCIESLFSYTVYPFKVIVVDNSGVGEIKASLPPASNTYVEVLEPENNL